MSKKTKDALISATILAIFLLMLVGMAVSLNNPH